MPISILREHHGVLYSTTFILHYFSQVQGVIVVDSFRLVDEQNPRQHKYGKSVMLNPVR